MVNLAIPGHAHSLLMEINKFYLFPLTTSGRDRESPNLPHAKLKTSTVITVRMYMYYNYDNNNYNFNNC